MLRRVLFLAAVVGLGLGCEKSTATVTPATPAKVPDGAVDPRAKEIEGRPLFVDAPELAGVLELGLVTQIDESWVGLAERGKVNHCFAVYLEFDDVQKTGAAFNDLVRGLGHEPEITDAAITVEKEGLLVALMLTGTDQAIANACWAKKTSAAKAYDALIPDDPPLSEGRDIATNAGGIVHVTLEWSADRGVSLRLAGSIEKGKAKAVAAWFRTAGYGDVQPDGELVEHVVAEDLTTFTAVHEDGWIIELNQPEGESPFQR